MRGFQPKESSLRTRAGRIHCLIFVRWCVAGMCLNLIHSSYPIFAVHVLLRATGLPFVAFQTSRYSPIFAVSSPQGVCSAGGPQMYFGTIRENYRFKG